MLLTIASEIRTTIGEAFREKVFSSVAGQHPSAHSDTEMSIGNETKKLNLVALGLFNVLVLE